VGVEFWVGVDGCFEAFHVFEAELVHHGQHFAFDLFHLVEAELMNLFGDRLVVVLSFTRKAYHAAPSGRAHAPGSVLPCGA